MVGRIMNIIGPVKRPYILVKPKMTENHQQLQLIGEKLYIVKESKDQRKNKKR
jgi:rRNA processing protein Gar1